MASMENVVRTMTLVRYPFVRGDVIFSIATLADPEYQQRVWIDHIYPTENYYDAFDETIHTLYDDTGVMENPMEAIGYVLRSQAEAEAMYPLRYALDTLYDVLGIELSDAEYIASPLWDDVVDAAQRALAVLHAHTPATDESTLTATDILWDQQRDFLVGVLDLIAQITPATNYLGRITGAVTWLVNDTSWGRLDPADSVGTILRDEGEAAAIRAVLEPLLAILDEIGPARPDQENVRHPRWPEVAEAAQRALTVLRADSPDVTGGPAHPGFGVGSVQGAVHVTTEATFLGPPDTGDTDAARRHAGDGDRPAAGQPGNPGGPGPASGP